jgi:hypothetical protein
MTLIILINGKCRIQFPNILTFALCKKLLSLFFLLAFTAKLFAHDSLQCYQPDPNGRYREHNVDFQKLVLEVTFQPKAGKVTGVCEL